MKCKVYQGNIDGKGKKLAIVISRFNNFRLIISTYHFIRSSHDSHPAMNETKSFYLIVNI